MPPVYPAYGRDRRSPIPQVDRFTFQGRVLPRLAAADPKESQLDGSPTGHRRYIPVIVSKRPSLLYGLPALCGTEAQYVALI
jgi:hypothetical protein